MSADALAVFESVAPDGDWPGVSHPDEFRAQLADWFSQYANVGTRRTYAYALGLPVEWVSPVATAKPGPPPGPKGLLHDLAWFRWCARRDLDPRAATAADVKAWLHLLDAA
ncbi:MAG: integrase, partial [Pseudonocardia sp.]|nr:integrase [Pseudonocardia sp.]